MEKSEKTALLAIVINLGIFLMKYVAASASGSIALKAEAFHTFADFIASLSVFVGLKIAKRKSKSFPYGLYKIENLMSVFISLVILYTGYDIVLEVINTPFIELENSWMAIGSLVVATGLTFWFSRYEKKVGQEINSPILLADAAHIHIDVLSNVVVLLAILSNLLGYQLDKIAAMIVAAFILKTGIEILLDGARVLLDASIDHETLSKVEKIILNHKQVVELKTLTGRNSGRFKFIEANIVLNTNNLDHAHFVSDKIERLIKDEIKNIDQVLIHYEPLKKEELIYVLPLKEDQAFISSHFGEASRFMFVTFKAGEMIAQKVDIIKNPNTTTEKGKGILSAEFIAGKKVDFVIVKNAFANKGPMYVFSNFNIEVLSTEEETPEEALEKLGLTLNS